MISTSLPDRAEISALLDVDASMTDRLQLETALQTSRSQLVASRAHALLSRVEELASADMAQKGTCLPVCSSKATSSSRGSLRTGSSVAYDSTLELPVLVATTEMGMYIKWSLVLQQQLAHSAAYLAKVMEARYELMAENAQLKVHLSSLKAPPVASEEQPVGQLEGSRAGEASRSSEDLSAPASAEAVDEPKAPIACGDKEVCDSKEELSAENGIKELSSSEDTTSKLSTEAVHQLFREQFVVPKLSMPAQTLQFLQPTGLSLPHSGEEGSSSPGSIAATDLLSSCQSECDWSRCLSDDLLLDENCFKRRRAACGAQAASAKDVLDYDAADDAPSKRKRPLSWTKTKPLTSAKEQQGYHRPVQRCAR